MGRKRSALGQALGFAPSALALGAARLLPYGARITFGGWLGRRLVLGIPRFRSRVEANLAYVMPDLDAAGRRAIAREVGDTFGRTFVEIFSMAEFQRRAVWTGPTGPGAEALAAAAKGRTGAVVVTGHLGQWEAGRAWLKAIGAEAAGVYRPLNNGPLDRIYVRQLGIGGQPMFPKGRPGLRGMMDHLGQGGVVAMLTDQYDRRAAAIDFLGRPAPTITIAADLARKFGVPLFPVYGLRDPDGRHVAVIVEAPIPRATSAEMTRAVSDSLAARVRAHPGQYLWLHQRWAKGLPAPKP